MTNSKFQFAVVNVETNEIKGGLWTSASAAEKIASLDPDTYLVVHVSHFPEMGIKMPKGWA